MLDMNGRSMVERVLDAVQDSKYVDEVVVVGLDDPGEITTRRPIHLLPNYGGLVSNAIAGVDWLTDNRPKSSMFLACSGDLPLLTGDILDEYIESCQPFDHGLHYIFVAKETMETRFPDSNRTFTKLKGIEVAGGDITVMQFAIVHENRELWEMLANARKHAWKIARIVGLRMVVKLLTRRITIEEIETIASRLIGMPARVVISTHAELAMDADKPHQIDLLREELHTMKVEDEK
jgi:GTP:adenosylcobinamide-phosphate guanylyltransferase